MNWKQDIFGGGEHGGYLVDSVFFLCSDPSRKECIIHSVSMIHLNDTLSGNDE